MDFIMEVEDLHGSEGNYSGYERLSYFLITSGNRIINLLPRQLRLLEIEFQSCLLKAERNFSHIMVKEVNSKIFLMLMALKKEWVPY